MLTSIKGIYENGRVTLTEEPPFAAPSEVIVTFLPVTDKKPERKLGGLEGKVNLPDNFNEPLESLKGYML